MEGGSAPNAPSQDWHEPCQILKPLLHKSLQDTEPSGTGKFEKILPPGTPVLPGRGRFAGGWGVHSSEEGTSTSRSPSTRSK